MNRIKNKVAIITGGVSGIGKAAAALFAQGGAKVLITDLSEEVCKTAVIEIGSENISYLAGDVTKAGDKEIIRRWRRQPLSATVESMFFLQTQALRAIMPIFSK